MHTQEQRTKAVMLFIETGFNHAAVKSALGYPSRWSLDRWYADYLDKGYVKEKREHWEKFSDDEKAIAVAKYFELDCHLSNAVKELGYPSRSLLTRWIDELAPGLRKKTKPRKKHGDPERDGVVAAAYAGERTVAEAIREAGIDKVTFYNWRRRLLGGDTQKVVGDLRNGELPDDVGELREMIETQRRELRRLQLEPAVWKGAAELVKKTRAPTRAT